MANASRTFRVFLSSTFSDLIAERNALAERAFPALRSLCEDHGCRFQAVDLRWGISDEAALDQRAIPICLEELTRCQQISPRPNFIILLGDRYGWRPVPFEISAVLFDLLLTRISSREEQELLNAWYRLDENAIPPHYVLQPRSGRFENPRTWERLERQIREYLLKAANQNPQMEVTSFRASATEQEILAGALAVPEAAGHVFAFFRTIEGLPDDTTAGVYADLIDNERDREATELLQTLKSRLRSRLSGNVYEYRAKWLNGQITTDHLKNLCNDVERQLSQVIRREISEIREIDPIELERQAHEEFRASKTVVFVGRGPQMERIEEYIEDGRGKPLIVSGLQGYGKTTLLSRAVDRIRKMYPGAVVIARFVGATAASTVGHTFLTNLCAEISNSFGVKIESEENRDVRSDEERQYGQWAPKLALPDFSGRLRLADAEKPLVVVLDGLDQFSPKDPASDLHWLPLDLPEHARVIVAVESKHFLTEKLPPDSQLLVEAMSPVEGHELLSRWLERATRRLQPAQESHALAKFEAAGRHPLYLQLFFEEVRQWKSYDALPSGAVSRTNVQTIIRLLFARLSDPANHGELLVSRVLAFLSASRNGLAEDELLDILSLDQELMTNLKKVTHHHLLEQRLPFVVWSRLYHDLEPYLRHQLADGTTTISFDHGEMKAEAARIFLEGESESATRKHLSAYFQSSRIIPRKASELTYQFYKLEDWKALGRTLSDPKLLASAWNRDIGESFALWMNLDARTIHIEKNLLAPSAHKPLLQDENRALGEFLYRIWMWKQASNQIGIVKSTQPDTLSGILRSAVEFTKRAGSPKHFADLILALVQELNRTGDISCRAEILSLLTDLEDAGRELGDLHYLASALGGQAKVFQSQGRLQEALERFNAQAQVLKELGDAKWSARCEENKESLLRQINSDSTGIDNEAKAFAAMAVGEKISTSIRFPEIPIYLRALYRAYNPSGTPATEFTIAFLGRFSFRCNECGVLDSEALIREYDPRKSVDELSDKVLCPFCGRTERTILSYDPHRSSPDSVNPKKPWWKLW